MRYLVDTCVLSDLVAQRPNPGLVEWVDRVDEARLYICVISIGEIQKGIQKLAPSERRQSLTEWLTEDLLIRFKDRILPVDTQAMLAWGTLTAELEKRGQPMPAIDSMIAAVALQNGLTLVTRNEADFLHSGVRVLNPWRD